MTNHVKAKYFGLIDFLARYDVKITLWLIFFGVAASTAGIYYSNVTEINLLNYTELSDRVYSQSDNKEFMDYLHKANEDSVISISEFNDLNDIAHEYNRAFYLEKSKSSFNKVISKSGIARNNTTPNHQ